MAFEQTHTPDSKNVLGVFLPKIYVSKISLDLGAAGPDDSQIIVNDPHVGRLKYNKEYLPTVLAPEKYLPEQKWIPAGPPNTTNKSLFGTNRDLKVSVEFQVKDKVGHDSLLSWILDGDLGSYLKYITFISTSAQITSHIMTKPSHRRQMMNIITKGALYNPKKVKDSNLVFEMVDHISKTAQIGSVKDNFFIKQAHSKKVTTKSEQVYTELDSNGNTIFSFLNTAQFDVKDNANPDHLALFAYAYIDIKELALKHEFESADIPEGVVAELADPADNGSVEIILQNGTILKSTQQFKDRSGVVWLGPTYRMPDGTWMKGTVHDPNLYETADGMQDAEKLIANSLTVENMLNTKVHDFRDVYEIEKLEIDFTKNSDFFTEAHGALLNVGMEESMKYEDKNKQEYYPYFSKIRLATDTSGRCRFLFDLDYHGLLKHNSVYPGLFKATSGGEELLNFSKIVNMQIMRRRVVSKPKFSNRLGTALHPMEYEKDKFPVKIAVSGENSMFKFEPKDYFEQTTTIEPTDFRAATADRNITKKMMGSLKEHAPFTTILSFKHNKTIRSFSGVDVDMGRIGAGFYQYGVRVEFQDPTITYVRNKLNILRQSASAWDDYYKYVLSNPEFQNIYTGRFTKKFLHAQSEDESAAKYSNAVLAFGSFITTMSTFLNAKSLMTKKMRNFILIASPEHGNVKGVDAVSKLMHNFIIKVEKHVRDIPTEKRSFSITGDNSKLNPDKKQKENMVAEHWFDEIHNASSDGMRGYEYLSTNLNTIYKDERGLRIVTNKNLQTRHNVEMNSYPSGADKIEFAKEGEMIAEGSWKAAPQYLTPYCARLPSAILKDGTSTKHHLFRADKTELAEFALDVLLHNDYGTAQRDIMSSYNDVVSNDLVSARSAVGIGGIGYISETSTLAKENMAMPIEAQRHRAKLAHLVGQRGCTISGKPGFSLFAGRNALRGTSLNPLANLGKLATTKVILPDGFGSTPSTPPPNPLTTTFLAEQTVEKDVGLKNYSLNKSIDFADDFAYGELEALTGDRTNPNSLLFAIVGLANLGMFKYSDFIKLFDFLSAPTLVNILGETKSFHKNKLIKAWEQWKDNATSSTNTPFTAAAYALLDDPVSALPPQLLTLAAEYQGGDGAANAIPTFSNIAMRELRNKKIARIKVLDGYKTNFTSLKNEVWRDLTQKDLDGVGVPPAQLCKITFYSNALVEVGKNDPLHLPTYDEYFVLAPNVTSPLTQPAIKPPPHSMLTSVQPLLNALSTTVALTSTTALAPPPRTTVDLISPLGDMPVERSAMAPGLRAAPPTTTTTPTDGGGRGY